MYRNSTRKNYRNIEFVSKSNENYQVFFRHIIDSKKENRIKYESPVERDKFISIISRLFEKVITKQIQSSQERVLSYEELNPITGRWQRKFREIDGVNFENDKIILSEIKVSSRNDVICKAIKQLCLSKEILNEIFDEIEIRVIFVGLEPTNEKSNELTDALAYQTTPENYTKTGVKYSLLKLPPEYVFSRGIELGIIKDTELLEKALNEAERLIEERNERLTLKLLNTPHSMYPKHLLPNYYETTNVLMFGDRQSETLLANKLSAALLMRA